MKVKAKRHFISAVYGNVKAGMIINVTDRNGRIFIQHGMVEEVKTATNEDAQKMIDRGEAEIPKDAVMDGAPDPIQPTTEETPGASSQAAQVSQKKTVKKSTLGKGKAKKGKSRS